MKVLSLSLDQTLLIPGSKTSRRIGRYGEVVERYDVLLASSRLTALQVSDRTSVYGSGGVNKIIRLFLLWRRGRKLMATQQYDLVTSQDPHYLGLVAHLISPVVEIQVHGFEKRSWFRRKIESFNFHRAVLIRTVSERLKQELVSSCGIAEDKIYVAAVRAEASCPPRENHSAEIRFITASRLVPVKNIASQLRAFVEVAKAYPSARLWIVGDGPERQRLESLAAVLGLYQVVKFWGWQEDVPSLLSQADIFVLSSFSEGWGLVAVEAAACGLPVIMTEVGCAEEFIRDGENGLVVPVDDEEALAQAMARLIQNEIEREHLGRQAKMTAEALPDLPVVLKDIATRWQKVII